QPNMLEIVLAGSSIGSGVRMLLERFGVAPNEVFNGEQVIGISNDEDEVADAVYMYAFYVVLEREPLPLIIHHLPVAVTFGFIGDENIVG
ncbi:hypothetical protein Tco_1452691, partial [Tanacetum coccineum]